MTISLSLQIVLLILSVVAGGILVEVVKNSSILKLLLSFSGGFLLTIIFTHILPELYHEVEYTGVFILVGFFLQLILEYFSRGAEHGHTHVHSDHQGHNHHHHDKTNLKHFPIAIFVSLCIHGFVEAIPLNHGLNHEHDLFWGVIIHNIPVAVALKTILIATGVSRRNSWIYLMIFALTAPFGILFGQWVLEVSSVSLSWLLATAVGMFFHVSTTIIFESSEGHKINLLKLIAILIGFGLGIAFI